MAYLRVFTVFQKPLKGKKQSRKTETTRQSATDTSFNEKIRKRDSGTGNKCHRCRQHLSRYAENSGCCQPLIRGGRAIRVHQSLPSSGSSARMLSTGYDSVHSQALSERSFESMGLDDIRRYINDQNELRRYGYGMAPPSVSSTGSSSGSNPTHTSTAHDSDEESDGSWGTTWESNSEEWLTGDENVIPQSLVYMLPESEGSEVSFHPRWEHSPIYQPPQTGRGKRKEQEKQ